MTVKYCPQFKNWNFLNCLRTLEQTKTWLIKRKIANKRKNQQTDVIKILNLLVIEPTNYLQSYIIALIKPNHDQQISSTQILDSFEIRIQSKAFPVFLMTRFNEFYSISAQPHHYLMILFSFNFFCFVCDDDDTILIAIEPGNSILTDVSLSPSPPEHSGVPTWRACLHLKRFVSLEMESKLRRIGKCYDGFQKELDDLWVSSFFQLLERQTWSKF